LPEVFGNFSVKGNLGIDGRGDVKSGILATENLYIYYFLTCLNREGSDPFYTHFIIAEKNNL